MFADYEMSDVKYKRNIENNVVLCFSAIKHARHTFSY
jgi:hypothetical protein